jgi:hypothetical protein
MTAAEEEDPQDLRLPEGFQPLVGMLEIVAFGMIGRDGDVWAEFIYATLADVGVKTLHDFVSLVLVVNRKLADHGHDNLCQTTLNMMLIEVCHMLIWLVEAED